MTGPTLEGRELVIELPGCLTNVEGAVITEMSCLGADLLYVYEPPCDVLERGAPRREADSRVMFWDFPGLSQTFFHRLPALALFLPVRWILRESPLGVWLQTTIPQRQEEMIADPRVDSVLNKLAENLQTAFRRVCEKQYPAESPRMCD